MSMAKEILEELWNTELQYKGMVVNIFGVPKFGKYHKRNIRTAIDRMTRNGILIKEKRGVALSTRGKEYVKRKIDSLQQFKSPKKISKEKKLLLMFDIPESRKAEREWLRWHLKKFGYIIVQKSVWVGPFPLPEEFKKYLKVIKLEKHIKTFKLANSYTNNNVA